MRLPKTDLYQKKDNTYQSSKKNNLKRKETKNGKDRSASEKNYRSKSEHTKLCYT